MQNYHAPCSTFEEAQTILSMHPSELAHAIRAKEITPVVYTKNRQMLIFSYRRKLNWGHATCLYRGHLNLPDAHIEVLLEGDSVALDNNFGTLLDPEGVQSYSTTYPFKRPTPRAWLHDWSPIERSRLVLEAARATPLPGEGKPILDTISDFVEVLTSHKNDGGTVDTSTVLKEDINKLEFDFKSNSTFEPQNLRIPASEIKKYKQRLAVSSCKPLIDNNSNPHGTITTGSRTNQLHTLLTRILNTNPKITAKAAWRVMGEEVNRVEPLFDTENILQVVDPVCIEWRSRHGKDQSVRWSSFQSLLSKLRRQITET